MGSAFPDNSRRARPVGTDMQHLTILMAQMNTLVGDFEGNTRKVIATLERATEHYETPVLVFPELTLCGYPPEDLLLRPSIDLRLERALQRVCAASRASQAHLVLGYPRRVGGSLFNTAGVVHRGEIVAEYHKQCLPNYQVFDEKRYFAAGDSACNVDIRGVPVGLSICEDIWEEWPARQAAAAGARLLLNINASPYHRGKRLERWELVGRRARDNGLPIVYVNQVGGQDELVFDGGSFAVSAAGDVVAAAPNFTEGEHALRFDLAAARPLSGGTIAKPLDEIAATWQALVLGVRDYVDKNGFKGVVLGLSGGVDSALTLAVAVEALGAERVEAVMMPFRYTSQMSVEDAAGQSRLLGVRHSVIPIEAIYDAFMASLADEFAGMVADTTEENLQARCRGVILMSLSNKKGLLVLTTGNKSELAVGYSTLYGDMAGGFDVLKDVPKTLVFALCRYRNSLSPCIPQRVIERPPSAELRPDQKDEDSLPPYEVLDRILELYVEQDHSAEAIIAAGLDREQVHAVLRLVDLNEYKRRQAPIGVRITRRGFGRDRRYPITSGWKPGY